MKLMWLVHSRPDFAYCAASCVQTPAEQWPSSAAVIRDFNATIRNLQKKPDASLRFPKLDKNSLQIWVYCDAVFANNEDMSSQMGFIVFVTDQISRCAPMTYQSGKCKRITRSVLAAEAIDFAEGFDEGFALKNDLREALGINVPLIILTDSKTLFDVITKAYHTRERGSSSTSHANERNIYVLT
jgi:hypothetical protein